VAGIETFGAAASDPGAMVGGDPEDYFTRLGLSDSLFKTVEKRYGRRVSLGLKTRCKSRVFFGKEVRGKGVRPTSQADKPEKKAGHFAGRGDGFFFPLNSSSRGVPAPSSTVSVRDEPALEFPAEPLLPLSSDFSVPSYRAASCHRGWPCSLSASAWPLLVLFFWRRFFLGQADCSCRLESGGSLAFCELCSARVADMSFSMGTMI